MVDDKLTGPEAKMSKLFPQSQRYSEKLPSLMRGKKHLVHTTICMGSY